jgi:hypothetical protein
MPNIAPLTAAAGDRPRPRAVPQKVKLAIRAMVYGVPGDADHAPLDFVAAAKLVGMDPPTLRKYFDRGDCRQLLLSERRAFRTMLCAGNEAALARIRDGENAAAAVKAVQVLEGIDEADAERHGRVGQREVPGVTIVIQQASTEPAEPLVLIPAPTPAKPTLSPRLPEPEPPADPIFRPPRRW